MANHAILIRDKLADAVRTGLKVPAREAQRFALGFVDGLSNDLGSRPLYLGKRVTTDEEVLADFNGNNHDEVCTKHNISRRTLDRKVKAAVAKGKGQADGG